MLLRNTGNIELWWRGPFVGLPIHAWIILSSQVLVDVAEIAGIDAPTEVPEEAGFAVIRAATQAIIPT